MNIYLVIPSYNEEEQLNKTILKTSRLFPPSKTIVVDDGSKKRVRPYRDSNIWLLRHKINLGKGAAMRTGAEFAFKQGADAVIFMDADGQHDPKEIKRFVKLLNSGKDVVLGVRNFGADAPLSRLLGRKLIALFIRLLYGIYTSDILSGYRGVTKRAYKLIKWDSDRYAVETEMIINLAKRRKKLKWQEIPIETIYHFKYKGMTLIDGFKLIFNVLSWRVF